MLIFLIIIEITLCYKETINNKKALNNFFLRFLINNEVL